MEWVIVKGISNYGDRNQSSSDEWKCFASTTAASVVANILSDPVVFQGWPHYSQGKCYNKSHTKVRLLSPCKIQNPFLVQLERFAKPIFTQPCTILVRFVMLLVLMNKDVFHNQVMF